MQKLFFNKLIIIYVIINVFSAVNANTLSSQPAFIPHIEKNYFDFGKNNKEVINILEELKNKGIPSKKLNLPYNPHKRQKKLEKKAIELWHQLITGRKSKENEKISIGGKTIKEMDKLFTLKSNVQHIDTSKITRSLMGKKKKKSTKSSSSKNEDEGNKQKNNGDKKTSGKPGSSKPNIAKSKKKKKEIIIANMYETNIIHNPGELTDKEIKQKLFLICKEHEKQTKKDDFKHLTPAEIANKVTMYGLYFEALYSKSTENQNTETEKNDDPHHINSSLSITDLEVLAEGFRLADVTFPLFATRANLIVFTMDRKNTEFNEAFINALIKISHLYKSEDHVYNTLLTSNQLNNELSLLSYKKDVLKHKQPREMLLAKLKTLNKRDFKSRCDLYKNLAQYDKNVKRRLLKDENGIQQEVDCRKMYLENFYKKRSVICNASSWREMSYNERYEIKKGIDAFVSIASVCKYILTREQVEYALDLISKYKKVSRKKTKRFLPALTQKMLITGKKQFVGIEIIRRLKDETIKKVICDLLGELVPNHHYDSTTNWGNPTLQPWHIFETTSEGVYIALLYFKDSILATKYEHVLTSLGLPAQVVINTKLDCIAVKVLIDLSTKEKAQKTENNIKNATIELEKLTCIGNKERIGPRNIPGWVLLDVEDDGNCFYRACADQLKRYGELIENLEVPETTDLHDFLRLRAQGAEYFNDREEADYPEILALARQLNVIIAIVDTRHPEQGFMYHYIEDNTGQYQYTNDISSITNINSPTIRLAYTGNHYLSVVTTPSDYDDILNTDLHSKNNFTQDNLKK